MKKIYLFIFTISCLTACLKQVKEEQKDLEYAKIPQVLSLTETDSTGLISLTQQELTPDSTGIIADIKLELPQYKKGIYFRPFSKKLAAGNRVEPLWFDDISDLDGYQHQQPRMDSHVDLGAFMMLQKENGNYLAVLPLVSNRIGNTFSIRDENIFLTVATYGTEVENLAVPLMSFGQSENPYEAVKMAWQQAMKTDNVKENINWREQKEYPEVYKYLGWCSWEHYKKDINEDIILSAIKGMKESSIPFRWMLIDDGYLDQKKRQLVSFGVDKTKFPNGWKSITRQKDDKIKWMGIWRNFNGYMQGISPEHSMSHLKEQIKNYRLLKIFKKNIKNNI